MINGPEQDRIAAVVFAGLALFFSLLACGFSILALVLK